MKIPNPVKLKFDPKTAKYGIIKKVFEDELARTLYLAISSTHKVGDDFGENCLNASEYIKIYCSSLDELNATLNIFFRKKGTPKYSEEFIQELFLYVDGKKKLEYIVNSGK